MRAGLILIIAMAAGVAAWILWPVERAERSERRAALPAREDPPPTEPAEPAAKIEEAPGAARGIVRGPNGEAVVDAEVRIDARDAIRTDGEGRFEFVWPGAAERVTIDVSHYGYLDVDDERSRAQSLDFTLERGLSVSGRVVFPDGSPVPNWSVLASNPGTGGPREMSSMRTDEDGRFHLTGLLSGNILVWTSDGFRNTSRTCEAGTSGLRFVMACSLLRVYLRLPNGEPALGASLRMTWPGEELSGYTDPDVRTFPVVTEAEPGVDVDISAFVPGCRAVRRTIPAWSTTPRLHDVRIDFEPSGKASVSLDVWKPGAVRPTALVVEVMGTTRKETFQAIANWPLRIDDLDPGPVVLRVRTVDQLFLVRELALIATVTERRPTPVELPLGAPVRVHCPDMAEYVGIRPVDSKIQFLMSRIGKDYISFRDVPEGTYVLFGFKGGQPTHEVEVTVKGTKEHRFDWPELTR